MIVLKKEQWVMNIETKKSQKFDSGRMIALLIIHLEYDCFRNSKLRTNPLNYTIITQKKEVEKKNILPPINEWFKISTTKEKRIQLKTNPLNYTMIILKKEKWVNNN